MGIIVKYSYVGDDGNPVINEEDIFSIKDEVKARIQLLQFPPFKERSNIKLSQLLRGFDSLNRVIVSDSKDAEEIFKNHPSSLQQIFVSNSNIEYYDNDVFHLFLTDPRDESNAARGVVNNSSNNQNDVNIISVDNCEKEELEDIFRREKSLEYDERINKIEEIVQDIRQRLDTSSVNAGIQNSLSINVDFNSLYNFLNEKGLITKDDLSDLEKRLDSVLSSVKNGVDEYKKQVPGHINEIVENVLNGIFSRVDDSLLYNLSKLSSFNNSEFVRERTVYFLSEYVYKLGVNPENYDASIDSLILKVSNFTSISETQKSFVTHCLQESKKEKTRIIDKSLDSYATKSDIQEFLRDFGHAVADSFGKLEHDTFDHFECKDDKGKTISFEDFTSKLISATKGLPKRSYFAGLKSFLKSFDKDKFEKYCKTIDNISENSENMSGNVNDIKNNVELNLQAVSSFIRDFEEKSSLNTRILQSIIDKTDLCLRLSEKIDSLPDREEQRECLKNLINLAVDKIINDISNNVENLSSSYAENLSTQISRYLSDLELEIHTDNLNLEQLFQIFEDKINNLSNYLKNNQEAYKQLENNQYEMYVKSQENKETLEDNQYEIYVKSQENKSDIEKQLYEIFEATSDLKGFSEEVLRRGLIDRADIYDAIIEQTEKIDDINDIINKIYDIYSNVDNNLNEQRDLIINLLNGQSNSFDELKGSLKNIDERLDRNLSATENGTIQILKTSCLEYFEKNYDSVNDFTKDDVKDFLNSETINPGTVTEDFVENCYKSVCGRLELKAKRKLNSENSDENQLQLDKEQTVNDDSIESNDGQLDKDDQLNDLLRKADEKIKLLEESRKGFALKVKSVLKKHPIASALTTGVIFAGASALATGVSIAGGFGGIEDAIAKSSMYTLGVSSATGTLATVVSGIGYKFIIGRNNGGAKERYYTKFLKAYKKCEKFCVMYEDFDSRLEAKKQAELEAKKQAEKESENKQESVDENNPNIDKTQEKDGVSEPLKPENGLESSLDNDTDNPKKGSKVNALIRRVRKSKADRALGRALRYKTKLNDLEDKNGSIGLSGNLKVIKNLQSKLNKLLEELNEANEESEKEKLKKKIKYIEDKLKTYYDKVGGEVSEDFRTFDKEALEMIDVYNKKVADEKSKVDNLNYDNVEVDEESKDIYVYYRNKHSDREKVSENPADKSEQEKGNGDMTSDIGGMNL